MSPVTMGVSPDGAILVASYPERAKVRNLRRQDRADFCVLSDDFGGEWVQVSGTATVVDLPEAMEGLVTYFRSISGEHPDWNEYRQAMTDQGKVLIRVALERWGPISKGGFPPRLQEASPPSSHREPIRSDKMQTARAETSSEALTTLRGSSVGNVNVRRVGQVILALSMATLLVLSIVFLVAGVHRNSQVSSLRNKGVPAEMTVTQCAVLIGGTGSNPVGDACRGTFVLDGRRYSEGIPGAAQHSVGDKLRIIVVPGDPALLAPTHVVASEHTSASVFVLPVVLFVVFLLAVGWLGVVRRNRSQRSSPA